MDKVTVMAIVLLVADVILLVAFIANNFALQKYYRRIVNGIYDGTYALKEVKYSSTNHVKACAWLMLIWAVIGGVLLLLGSKVFSGSYFFGFVVGTAIVLVVILARGKREITLSDEGVTLKRCATINGADQDELSIAWDEIESVSIAEKQRAVITLTNGSKVEVKLNYIAPKRRFTNSWDSQEIVWQIEQRLRQRKV